jgi:hypothetical protein
MGIWANIEKKIELARKELETQGYSVVDMNNVFGDDNLYFPKSTREVSQTVGIIDNLINNKQYTKKEKRKLAKMVNDAYKFYRIAKPGSISVDESDNANQDVTVEVDKESETNKKTWKDMKKGTKIAIVAGSAVVLGGIIWLIVRKK